MSSKMKDGRLVNISLQASPSRDAFGRSEKFLGGQIKLGPTGNHTKGGSIKGSQKEAPFVGEKVGFIWRQI